VERTRQGTIGETVRLTGIGLHTGRFVEMVLRPAAPHTGIRFSRTPGGASSIPAALDAVTGTAGRVSLGGEEGVQTVEHLLSAAWATGVDNMEVELNGGEVPGMDGSALPIVQAIREAGVRPQDAIRPVLQVSAPTWVGDGRAWAVALPAPRFGVACVVTLQAPRMEDQAATYDPAQDRYEEVIAPARTWGYEREAEALRGRGLALGASLENTLVIGGTGYLNPPRFANEAARHKILDLLGDLALLGRDIQGFVIAVRAGHAWHVALARALRDQGG
jgi:UDP-3-O-[3-hydroxymyristoyl] N-acetylglucosamine deacetylase